MQEAEHGRTVGQLVVENWGKLSGMAAGAVTLMGLLGREIVRDWWEDFRAGKKAKREALVESAKSGAQMQHDLLEVMRGDVAARRETEGRIFEVLERHTKALEAVSAACIVCSKGHSEALGRILENQVAIKAVLGANRV